MLNKIIERKRQDLEQFVMPEATEQKKPRGFTSALEAGSNLTGIGLIAEIKRASPSKGQFASDLDVAKRAAAYERGGADVISVLTDEPFFQGSISDLQIVKESSKLPILRKDFIIEERQIEESSRIGADAILLIAAVLSGKQIAAFMEKATTYELDVLVEVHNEAEIRDVLAHCTPKLMGINNRNLKTFETSLEKTVKLAKLIPNDCLIVSESGIAKADDVTTIRQAGAKAMLVGEHLVTGGSPEEMIPELKKGAKAANVR